MPLSANECQERSLVSYTVNVDGGVEYSIASVKGFAQTLSTRGFNAGISVHKISTKRFPGCVKWQC